MSFAVLIEPTGDLFAASLAGAPHVRVVAANRDDAIEGLRREVRQRLDRGELAELELAPVGVSKLAGTYVDDPALRDICNEAYRQRDTDRPK